MMQMHSWTDGWVRHSRTVRQLQRDIEREYSRRLVYKLEVLIITCATWAQELGRGSRCLNRARSRLGRVAPA
jgi:hypothetical protein